MADPLWINSSAGAPAYSANELRQAMALALMYGGRAVGARDGVRPGGTQLQVSLAGSTITVQPGVAVADPALSTPQGPYWVALPVAETFALSAADATNPRKDIVVLRVYDHDEDASGLRLARSEYIVGVANPAPAQPAVPAGAQLLALIDVPATPGAPVVTDKRHYTVASGGILPVADAASRPAGYLGQALFRLDLKTIETHNGAAFETAADPGVFKDWTAYTPAWSSIGGTPPAIGNGSLSGSFMRVGKTLTVQFRMVAGSTTTFGSGTPWLFGLPAGLLLSGSAQAGSAALFDSSASLRVAASIRGDGTNTNVTAPTASGNAAATTPFTWASGDELIGQGTFRIQ